MLLIQFTRLNHQVKAAGKKDKSQDPTNTSSTPDLKSIVHNNNLDEQNRQSATAYNLNHPQQHGQDYAKGEDQTDRITQYSWVPLPKRGGEERTLPRQNYGQSLR